MKQSKKEYWKGIEELNPSPEFLEDAKNEFPDKVVDSMEGGSESSRRDFLKTLGFGMAAVSLAACEAPIRKAIPYLNKPEEIDPGVPNYYASSYMTGGDYCSVVVKTREGRPIKIEGNKLSSITQGGTNARVQASVLSLYDEDRLRGPMEGTKSTTWKDLDSKVGGALAGAASVAIVSNTIISPSTKRVIAGFKAKYAGTKHVSYDAVSYSGMLEANQAMFGKYALPSLDFTKAEVIVSFGADFLGTWISDIEYSKQYSKGKKVSNKSMKMSRHYQFESMMSMTGANADYRTPILPSEQGTAIAALYNAVAASTGGEKISVTGEFENIKEAAKDLLAAKGKSLVVANSNDTKVQTLVNKLNELLGNYGKTIDMDRPSFQRQGNDAEMTNLVSAIKAGNVDAVIFMDCNPVYNHSMGADLATAIKSLKMSVSTAVRNDETSQLCKFTAPNSHYLESWNDAEPKMGAFSVGQPTISKLFDTRQSAETLMAWSGQTGDYLDLIKENWSTNMMPLQTESVVFDMFWNKSLHDGVFETTASYESVHLGMASEAAAPVANEEGAEDAEGDAMMDDGVEAAAVVSAGGASMSEIASAIKSTSGGGMEFIRYQKVAIGEGDQLNNPWLHECPDPVTKACWGDYASMSYKTATDLKVTQDDLVNVFAGNTTVKLPVLIQPGQVDGTVGVAYGYGAKGGKCMDVLENTVNVYPMADAKIAIVSTGETFKVAQTQTHQTYFQRESVVQESTLEEYKDLDQFVADKFTPLVTGADGIARAPKEYDLYDKYDYNNHHWGLVIDMNSCTGCSACVVACTAENNIPTVGRQEVINRRDMHWMRIDRYYSHNVELYGDKNNGGEKSRPFGPAMSDDEERIQGAEPVNPEVVFQPMMCQHCNHASCENVCPVAATSHSSEGLNMMAYNRCIGTRYCANNCAYKVRRFNWFNYADNDLAAEERGFGATNPVLSDLGRMVLNPDVVVRFRGVMEKCTMCVQRIQYGKLEAKKESRRPVDGDILTACQQACPADAITFGDKNDPKSQISIMTQDEQKERAFVVLEEVNTQPNVHYLTKIRNKSAAKA